jgi:hypothetical protein
MQGTNKRQLIDDIRQFNVGVEPEFLQQFDEPALAQYLTHLQDARQRNARIASWSRKPSRERCASH